MILVTTQGNILVIRSTRESREKNPQNKQKNKKNKTLSDNILVSIMKLNDNLKLTRKANQSISSGLRHEGEVIKE